MTQPSAPEEQAQAPVQVEGEWKWDAQRNQWYWDAPGQPPYYAPAQAATATTADPSPVAVLSGKLWTAVKLHLSRTFSVATRSDLILAPEKQELDNAATPIKEPHFQAFMAWRKSVISVAAVLFIPAVILDLIGLIDSAGDLPGGLVALSVLLFLIGACFVAALWMVRRFWTSWERSRRILLITWSAYFLAPFVLYLIPLRAMFSSDVRNVAGISYALAAFIYLLPRALSLLPGVLRAAITAKIVFPGATAPGWLMMLTAPFYALFFYVILLVPYQATGDPLLLLSIVGFIGAPIWLGKLGAGLARPLPVEESLRLIKKARVGYLALNAAGVVFLLAALGDVIEGINIGWLDVISFLLTVFANVLILGVIGTDAVLLSLERARQVGDLPGAQEAEWQHERQLRQFIHGRTTGVVPIPDSAPPPAPDESAQQG